METQDKHQQGHDNGHAEIPILTEEENPNLLEEGVSKVPKSLQEFLDCVRLFEWRNERLHSDKATWLKDMHQRINFDGDEPKIHPQVLSHDELYSILRKVTRCSLPVVYRKGEVGTHELIVYEHTEAPKEPRHLLTLTEKSFPDNDGFGAEYVSEFAGKIFEKLFSNSKNKVLLGSAGLI
jgi:hypothetical protein